MTETKSTVVVSLCAILFVPMALGEQGGETDTTNVSGSVKSIRPLDGCAWVEQQGIRAAWLSYKQLDETMARQLRSARVNTVFLRHGFHDLLDLNTARWDSDQLVVSPREQVMKRALQNTKTAARNGIHVFWLANYELEQMLPHLRRLGYQQAFAEGPGRYLPNGLHDDAAPLDRTFWHGFTGAHGELVARLSREHPIDGVIYDTEHYAGGIMYLHNCGFSDATYGKFVASRQLGASTKSVRAGSRYEFLKSTGRLRDYYHFLEEEAYQQGRDLANRWHSVNPHLILGVWPLLDNWFSKGLLRGLGGAVPSLGLSGVEYYHGSEQTASIAEYFKSRAPNCIYMAGFYPPFAYTADELQHHVAQALRTEKHYWMLGPHRELDKDDYQTSLREALEAVSLPVAEQEVNLTYRVERIAEIPYLKVQMTGAELNETPQLSLWAEFGGAPLCKNQAMVKHNGHYEVTVPLLRRITNNRRLADGFRSGVSYGYDPTPQEFMYADPNHTKLIDGRAYGYFGTTSAWSKSIRNVSLDFDLHRPYRIVRVEVAQPNKLEDRIGGPSRLQLRIAKERDQWSEPLSFSSSFATELRNVTEPDTVDKRRYDKRHDRAWLSWSAKLPEATTARWLELVLQRVRNNSSISLGEVVIWAEFDGGIRATVETADSRLRVRNGSRWDVQLEELK